MSLEIGAVFDGTVTGIKKFGAFVKFMDGIGAEHTGLVHISEVSEGYVEDIATVLELNQPVKVKVLSIKDSEKVSNEKNISLSIKKASKRPASESNTYQKPERHSDNRRSFSNNSGNGNNFEDMLSRFMKDSDERMHDLKRSVDSKRGSSRR